jgi:hypothetical protein
MNIYIHKNDQQLGPFDAAQIAEGLSNGQFTPADLAWHEGLTEWVQLGELLKTNEAKPPIPENTQVINVNIFDSISNLRFLILLGAVIAIISFLFLSSGCEKTVNIEMFIRTKGGENIKLGLVDVKCYELDDCIEPMRKSAEYRDAGVKDYTLKKEEDEKEYEKKDKEIDIAEEKIETPLKNKKELKEKLEKKYEDIKKQLEQEVEAAIKKTHTNENYSFDYGLSSTLDESFDTEIREGLCEPDKIIKYLEKSERYRDYKSSIINLANYFKEVTSNYRQSIIDFKKYEKESQPILEDLRKERNELQINDIYYRKSRNEFIIYTKC